MTDIQVIQRWRKLFIVAGLFALLAWIRWCGPSRRSNIPWSIWA